MFAFKARLSSKTLKTNTQIYLNVFKYSNSFIHSMQLNDQIKLNIGGIEYETTLSTLTSVQNSLFTKLFNGEFPLAKDTRDAYCIKRDGKAFKYVLDYLQKGDLSQVQIPLDDASYETVIKEAKFYQLTSMVHQMQEQFPKFQSYILSFEHKQKLMRFVGCQLELLTHGNVLSFPVGMMHCRYYVVIKLKTGHIFEICMIRFWNKGDGYVLQYGRLLDSPHEILNDDTEWSYEDGYDSDGHPYDTNYAEINETDGSFSVTDSNGEYNFSISMMRGSKMLIRGTMLRKFIQEETWEKDSDLLCRDIENIEVFTDARLPPDFCWHCNRYGDLN